MLHTRRLFASIAYCGNILRLCLSIRSVVSIGSICFSPLQLSVYHLPIARMHCPIYMYREHLYAIIIYSFLPSMLHPWMPIHFAAAAAVPVVIINIAKIRRKLLLCKYF